jgi:hypothetical protein
LQQAAPLAKLPQKSVTNNSPHLPDVFMYFVETSGNAAILSRPQFTNFFKLALTRD